MEFLKKLRPPVPFNKRFLGIARAPPKLSSSAVQPKPDIQFRPLGLPLNLFIIYVASSINSIIVLLLSLLDLGYLSIWTMPPVSFFTVVSHFAFPFLAHAPRPESAPSYFSTVIVCVYILAAAWFIASIAALVVAGLADKWKWNLDVLDSGDGAATVGSQIAQVMFSWMEIGLLVAFGFIGHRRVIDNGEPESWRPPIREQDKSIVGLSTVMFDSGGNHAGEDESTKQVMAFQSPAVL